MSRLGRRFCARPSLEVAPALLGHVLARRLPAGPTLRARIVETEAYEPEDPASHAFGGPTSRNAVMFGPSGRLYVYFIYGMHFCMNVVTGADGHGSAVLLRAAEPLEGIEAMTRLRGGAGLRDLCRGPARWAQAFGVDRALDGADLLGGEEIWLERCRAVALDEIERTPRVGIRKAAELPWRFVQRDSPWASRGGRTPTGRPTRSRATSPR
ncbi:MAG: DNA-3-methyladenine glycosylase [Actinomycetota bacterium]